MISLAYRDENKGAQQYIGVLSQGDVWRVTRRSVPVTGLKPCLLSERRTRDQGGMLPTPGDYAGINLNAPDNRPFYSAQFLHTEV